MFSGIITILYPFRLLSRKVVLLKQLMQTAYEAPVALYEKAFFAKKPTCALIKDQKYSVWYTFKGDALF